MDSLLIAFPGSGVVTYVFLPPLVALCISFLTSTAGVSGAFLLLPFQMSVLGFTTPAVSATNLLYNVVGTPGGIYRYAREGRMAWPLAGAMTAGLIPGIFAGYLLRLAYLPDPRSFKLFVGGVLGYLAVRLAVDAVRGAPSAEPLDVPGASARQAPGRPLGPLRFHYKGLLSLSLVVGTVGGVYGIGGGAIMAPLCVAVFRLPVHRVAGAVLFATFVSSVAGVGFYSLVPVMGQVAPPDWGLGLLFGLGGLAGTYLGARIQRFLPERWIKVFLGGIVLAVAGRYVLGYFVP